MTRYSVTPDGPDAVTLRDHALGLAVHLTGRAAKNAQRWLDQGWTPDLAEGTYAGVEVVSF